MALATSLFARDKLAYIGFFGYRGIDVAAVRKALPFREGDAFSPGPAVEKQARAAVKRVTGRDATDVAMVCCAGDGDWVIFVGLPGRSSRAFTLNPAPQGKSALSPELNSLHEKMNEAEFAAVMKGEAVTDPVGYRLMKEPTARAAELAFREYVLHHEDEIVRVLESAREARQRAIAADGLGYLRHSPRQIAALVRAVRDPGSDVRNNATRALGEILRADPSGSGIAPDIFIDMVRSGTWTDRNKASAVLDSLTQSREPRLLARLKSEAGDALLEIARWHGDWSTSARKILARIAGVREDQVAGIR